MKEFQIGEIYKLVFKYYRVFFNSCYIISYWTKIMTIMLTNYNTHSVRTAYSYTTENMVDKQTSTWANIKYLVVWPCWDKTMRMRTSWADWHWQTDASVRYDGLPLVDRRLWRHIGGPMAALLHLHYLIQLTWRYLSHLKVDWPNTIPPCINWRTFTMAAFAKCDQQNSNPSVTWSTN